MRKTRKMSMSDVCYEINITGLHYRGKGRSFLVRENSISEMTAEDSNTMSEVLSKRNRKCKGPEWKDLLS